MLGTSVPPSPALEAHLCTLRPQASCAPASGQAQPAVGSRESCKRLDSRRREGQGHLFPGSPLCRATWWPLPRSSTWGHGSRQVAPLLQLLALQSTAPLSAPQAPDSTSSPRLPAPGAAAPLGGQPGCYVCPVSNPFVQVPSVIPTVPLTRPRLGHGVSATPPLASAVSPCSTEHIQWWQHQDPVTKGVVPGRRSPQEGQLCHYGG